MKTIALALLLALSTFAQAEVVSFIASDSGPHFISVASTPGTPRVSHTATLADWHGEIDYSAGYELQFNVDLVAGIRYYLIVTNATPRGVPSCGDGQVCPALVTVSRL